MNATILLAGLLATAPAVAGLPSAASPDAAVARAGPGGSADANLVTVDAEVEGLGIGGCVAQYFPGTGQWNYHGCYAYGSGSSDANADAATTGNNGVEVTVECSEYPGFREKFQVCPDEGSSTSTNSCSWTLVNIQGNWGCETETTATVDTGDRTTGPVDCGDTLYAVAHVKVIVKGDAFATNGLQQDSDADRDVEEANIIRSFDTYC